MGGIPRREMKTRSAPRPTLARHDAGRAVLSMPSTVRSPPLWPFLLRFHAAFAVAAAVALAPCFGDAPPWSLGGAVSALVVGWNAAFAMCAGESLNVWRFCAALSVLMPFPDMMLVRLGTLEFPHIGTPQVGGVSLFMAAMWSIPLVPVLLAGGAATPGPSRASSQELMRAALAALAIFGAAEHLTHPLRLWSATAAVRHRAGRAAVYVLAPEAVLGAAALRSFRASARGGAARRALAAAGVSALYAGALVASYALVEAGSRLAGLAGLLAVVAAVWR